MLSQDRNPMSISYTQYDFVVYSVGGLTFCPEEVKSDILEWFILLYIGEPGGYGMGQNRKVFYSNIGAPHVYDLIATSKEHCLDAFKKVQSESKKIKSACRNQYVGRRFESIVDLFQADA